MARQEVNVDFWDVFGRYVEVRETPIEEQSSWTDSLDDEWNAYMVFHTDTQEHLALVYREDLAFEFCKMLNEKFDISAYWSPDMCAGLRSEGKK